MSNSKGSGMVLLEEDCKKIHEAIHNYDKKQVEVNGQVFPIKVSNSNGCRNVKVGRIRFMEQNKKKNSDYARRARNGERITWGIKEGGWLFINDERVGGLK